MGLYSWFRAAPVTVTETRHVTVSATEYVTVTVTEPVTVTVTEHVTVTETAPALEEDHTPEHQLRVRLRTHPFTVDPTNIEKIERLKARCDRLRQALDEGVDLPDDLRAAYQAELDAKTNALRG